MAGRLGPRGGVDGQPADPNQRTPRPGTIDGAMVAPVRRGAGVGGAARHAGGGVSLSDRHGDVERRRLQRLCGSFL